MDTHSIMDHGHVHVVKVGATGADTVPTVPPTEECISADSVAVENKYAPPAAAAAAQCICTSRRYLNTPSCVRARLVLYCAWYCFLILVLTSAWLLCGHSLHPG